MPRFPLSAWMCLAGTLLLAPAALAQVETTGFKDVMDRGNYQPQKHPLLAGAPTPAPVQLPVTLDGGSTQEQPTEEVSADAAEGALVPQPVATQYDYVDQNEGAFQRLMRFYRHLMAKKYCFCENFVQGQWSATFIGGYLQTPFNWFGVRLGPGGPRLDFLPLNFRLQRIIRGNDGERRIKGSTELVVELTNMPIVFGSGNFLIGSTVSVRHNFSYTRRRFIPYVQFGGGAIYSDSWTGGADLTNLISGFNFVIHAAYGSKFFINKRLSFDAETAFYHFSNGGIQLPNIGVNGMAGIFGLTWYFNRD